MTAKVMAAVVKIWERAVAAEVATTPIQIAQAAMATEAVSTVAKVASRVVTATRTAGGKVVAPSTEVVDWAMARRGHGGQDCGSARRVQGQPQQL